MSNWYKTAMEKEAWEWKKFMMGFLAPVIPFALYVGISNAEIGKIIEKHPNNPVAVKQELQQEIQKRQEQQPTEIAPKTTPKEVKPSIKQKTTTEPTSQTTSQPTTQPEFSPEFMKTLTRHEGKRNKVYPDTKNIPTVGIGFNLLRDDAKSKLEALGLNYKAVLQGKQSLTDKQMNHLFEQDVITARNSARALVETFDQQPKDIQEVLINMSFNLGSLTEWPNFIKAINIRDYDKAAAIMRKSLWAGQVKGRATELIGIVQSHGKNKPTPSTKPIGDSRSIKR